MGQKILQWNIRSVIPKKHELIHLLYKFNSPCAAILETWLKPVSRFAIPGYACLRHDRLDGHDGAALLIRSDIKYTRISLPIFDDIYAVAVKLQQFSILCIYLPHPTVQIFNNVKVIFNLMCGPILILGDFNSHHNLWGSPISDAPGRRLYDLSDEFDLCVLNDGRPTRRTRPNESSSHVDVSFCSSSLASLLSWDVDNLTYGSDHAPIYISFPFYSPAPTFSPLQKFRIRSANWSSYSSYLDNKVDSLPSISLNNVQFCYDEFVSSINSAADYAIPIKKPPRKSPSPPWWDEECSKMTNDRNNAEISFLHDLSMDSFIVLKKAQALCKRTFKKKKQSSWNKYCESISPSTNPSLIWQNIKRFRSSLNSPPSPSSNTTEWSGQFLNKLAPPSCPSLLELPIAYEPSLSNSPFADCFSMSELKVILQSVSDSAPGADGILYSFIVNSSENTRRYYLELVNCMFSVGYVPESWKSQIIVPILKPGKEAESPNSYRPIALSSVLCKIAEHLIKNRLDWFVESKQILPQSQHGFRRGRGVSHSHSILLSDLRVALSYKETVVAAFLDISAAYDNVLISVLRIKLLDLSIPPKLVFFICNLLSFRKIYLRLNGVCSESRRISKGLPQGSVLSPILFNLYCCDLASSLAEGCNILQYADDICLYHNNIDINESVNVINSSLASLDNWLSVHGLELSPSKSSVVIFSRSRSLPDINIQIRNQSIPIQQKVKFLGLLLDSKLTGKDHIDYTIKKCDKNINILRALSGVWWGAHPYSQKLLYNALIRSLLDFGSFVLVPCHKSALHKLDLIQAKALRVVLGAMKSSPTRAMQVEAFDPPLHLRRQYLADRFLFQVYQMNSHPLIPKLLHLSDLIMSKPFWRHKEIPCLIISLSRIQDIQSPCFQTDKLPLYNVPFEAICSFSPIEFLDIKKNSANANCKFVRAVIRKWYNWDLFFTDACKLGDDDMVGSAFIHVNSDHVEYHKLPSQTSVFTGECIAILSSLIFIANHNISPSVIFSDSSSALQAISCNSIKNCARNPVICKIKNALFHCHQNDIKISLVWIPGHSGIEGNEAVDQAARKAVNIGNPKFFENFCFDLLPLSKKYLVSNWNDEWNCFSYKFCKIQPNIPSCPWFFNFKEFDKRSTSVLIRLRLGHSCSPVQLYKFRLRDSPLCDCGLEEGSIDHIFFNCPLNDKCPPLYSVIVSYNISLPVNMSYLLSFPSSDIICILALFIYKNDIKL